MSKENLKQVRRNRRKRGIRKRVIGTPERPRLTVTRTLKHTYAQIINDLDGKTIVTTLGTLKPARRSPTNVWSSSTVSDSPGLTIT